MNTLNNILTSIAGAVIEPFADYPVGVLVVVSIVSGVGMTWVFGKTSHQAALERTADRSKAQILAIRLFKEDLGVTLRAQRVLLAATFRRLGHSLFPMAVLTIPFVLLLTNLAVFYELRPHVPGDSALVTVEVAEEAWDRWRQIEPEVTSGLAVETAAHRDVDAHQLTWRVRVASADPAQVSWRVGDEIVVKRVDVARADSAALHRVSPHRPGPRFFDRVLFPSESAFAATDPVRSIRISHPARSTPIFGVDIPWWGTYLVVSMVTALACRRALGVVF